MRNLGFLLAVLTAIVTLNACSNHTNKLNAESVNRGITSSYSPAKKETSTKSTGDGISKFSLTKTRFVFKPGQRGDSLTIVNTGTKDSVYRASFINRKMYPDGIIRTLTRKEPNGRYSDDFIHVTPKEFTIKPGESQTVHLYARRPSNLTEGEYRSHLKFVILPENTESSLTEKGKGKKLSLKFQARPGFSVPVIVQHGKNLSVKTSITDLKLKRDKEYYVLHFALNRLGNISSYGDLVIKHISSKGKECELSNVQGVAVFPEVTKRPLKIYVKPCQGMPLTNGKISVEFLDNKDSSLIAKEILKL
ncbi:MAG: fimbria/pilus periplasmic chaperone [Alphaproteobacteria bacterium]|nr:fimbria/pilus periplasmic chaperone [Alphaproteobacteria bacterium]MBN2780087.1 fimbria/pilus periplasmic chaperone [Alphaproteobacteria bacterium]